MPSTLLATTSALALACALAAASLPAHAQTSWTAVTPGDWFDGGNWNAGVPNAATDAQINNGGTAQIGAAGAQAQNAYLGFGGSDSGTVRVSGPGTLTSGGNLFVGNSGMGTLTVENGGTVSNSLGVVAALPNSQGTVTVTGAGSSWTSSGILSVGSESGGSLTIAEGGAVSNATGRIGSAADGTGSVTVTGAGSSWSSSNSLTVGRQDGSTGTLTVADGGTVNVAGGANPLVVADETGSTGTLNIGAAPGDTPVAPGMVNASGIAFGAGTGEINFNHTSTNYVFAPTISGPGAVNQIAGTTVLTGNNSYSGGTFLDGGTLSVSQDANLGAASGALTFNGGTLQNTAAFTSTRDVILNASGGTFQTDADLTLSGIISGAGSLTKTGASTLTLKGNNTYDGATTIEAGTLVIDGDQSRATGLTTVQSGATLRGSGTIGGSVTVNGGGTLASQDGIGVGISKLTINRNLTLQSGANLNYDYGLSPNGNHDALMVEVGGNVSLNGTVNVVNSSGVALDPGVYGLIHYGGTLSGSFTAANLPAGFTVQTSVDGRVNIVNASGPDLHFWDGPGTPNDGMIEGGSGVWQAAAGNANWTTDDGSVNGSFADNNLAVFQGTPGTVTVDNSVGAVRVAGMQFAADGYTVTGDAITLSTDPAIVRVGDGTPNGAAYTATVESVLQGSAQLVKADHGTLVLTGTNTYAGGTTIDAGTLSVSRDDNLGGAGTGLTVDGGVLQVTGTSFTSTARPITWGPGGGGFDIADAANTFTVSQAITGTGPLTKLGPGTLDLTGANTYTGPTRINDGTLAVNGSLASPTTVNANGTLAGTGTIFNDVTNAGTVAPGPLASGFGALTIDGGNYVGNGGTLRIRTALGDDTSATDQLVINNGTATGSTGVRVVNQGGGGAATNIGIPIIIAGGSTTMEPTAFSLSGPVVAGLYQYRLFQGTPDGSGTSQEEQSWYLRSTEDDVRPEAPIYGLMPGIARALNVTTVGTFHERNGDQQLVRDNGGGWGRLFGHHREQGFTGTLNERFKGNAGGVQAGLDLFNWQQPDGSGQRAGVFFALAAAKGDAYGFALATPDRFVGDLRLTATSVGAYWTHIAPTGAYLDAVLMGSFYDGSGTSTNAIGISVDGSGATASLEAGLPIPLGGGITLEPQAQIIWQTLSLDGKDAFTSVDYGISSAWQGRLGVRLTGNFAPWGWTNVRPYLKANLIADWADEHRTTFASTDSIRTGKEVMLAEVGAGFVAQFTPTIGMWGVVDYRTDIDGGREEREVWRANAGLRVAW